MSSLFTFFLLLALPVFTAAYTIAETFEKSEHVPSYQDEPRFKEVMAQTLSRLKETGDNNIHERILAVNDVHKRFQNEAERDSSPITVDGIITETNLEQGLNYFEGDIVRDKYDDKLRGKPTWKRSTAKQDRHGLWAQRVIPYAISSSLNNVRTKIEAAVKKLSSVTCLRFYEVRDYTQNKNYIRFVKGKGCHSRIGTIYWKKAYQEISLGDGCHNVGTIIHEMMHALGFWHEQSRFDRDKHVRIVWENIRKGMESQFERYGHGDVDSFGVPYDYNSVMHYSRTAFTSNGEPTIIRLDKPKARLGVTGEGLMSQSDIVTLNALYDCTNSPAGHQGFSSWTKWTSCSEHEDCARERERFCINAPSAYLKKRYCPGANEYGIENQKRKCAPSECKPIDAGWGHWGKWADCNVKCGQGKRTRERRCEDPYKPLFGGKPCTGVKTDTVACSKGKCNLGYYETQFDGNMGRWRADTQAMFKWKLSEVGRNPGPKSDHTTGKTSNRQGMFAYAGTTFWSPQLKRVAKLTSPVMSGNPQCLTFFYVIDGASAKALAVRCTIIRNKKTWWIKHLEGPRGRDWHQAMAQIDVPNENVQITFEALAYKKGIAGAIAIDDVYFHPGRCQWPTPKPTAKPKPPPCIDINKLCRTWALKGECKKRSKYMLKNCRKSCVCQPVQCLDKNPKCESWAKKGECDKNKIWMIPNCCKACRAAADCKDKHVRCKEWAGKGECKKNKWMLKNCCKACDRR